jgi:hypothetical protein
MPVEVTFNKAGTWDDTEGPDAEANLKVLEWSVG